VFDSSFVLFLCVRNRRVVRFDSSGPEDSPSRYGHPTDERFFCAGLEAKRRSEEN